MRTSIAGSKPARGFTLVELLIVMVIIGVSVTFASVSLQRTMASADEEKWTEKTLRELNRVKNRAILSGRLQQLTLNFETGSLRQGKGEQTSVLVSLPEKFAYRAIMPSEEQLQREQAGQQASGMPLDSPEALLLNLRPPGSESGDAPTAMPEQVQTIIFYPDGSATELSFELLTPRGSRRVIRIHGLTGRVERLALAPA